ncbi:DUF2256 domain-containing protein [Chitinibacter tainanensis]|uniref:DUF2256 domain-containing protein n=1 Tax=Chitinibacter tainanensis TaxID=230667 RepID=UPI002355EB16|nr:DUF2256 domain-containing protein [Chitinibacter tainanensis]
MPDKPKTRAAVSAKAQLPSKLCPICQRPFSWRKKWERDWAQVKYCSQRCARAARGAGGSDAHN